MWTKFKIATISTLSLVLLLAGGAHPSHLPPNILLITADSLRVDALGCYNEELHKKTSPTPRIDALAQGGTVFLDAQSASPSTHASAMSLLFGVHVPVHGVYDDGFGRPEAHFNRPFPRLLGAAGYHTTLVGRPWLSTDDVAGSKHAAYAESRLTDDDSWRQASYSDIAAEALEWFAGIETPTQDGKKPWFLHVSLPTPDERKPRTTFANNHSSTLDDEDSHLLLQALDYEVGDRSKLPRISAELAGWGGGGSSGGGGQGESAGHPAARDNDGVDDLSDIAEQAAAARMAHLGGAASLDAAVEKVLKGFGLDGDGVGGANKGGKEKKSGADNTRPKQRDTLVVFTALTGAPLCDHGLGCPNGVAQSTVVNDETDGDGLTTTTTSSASPSSSSSSSSSLVGASSLAVPLIFRWTPSSSVETGDNSHAPSSTFTCQKPNSTCSSITSLIDVHASILHAARVPLPVDAQGFNLLHFSADNNNNVVAFSSPRVAAVSSELWSGYALITSDWKLCYYADHGEIFFFSRRPRSSGGNRRRTSFDTSDVNNKDGVNVNVASGAKTASLSIRRRVHANGPEFEHDNIWGHGDGPMRSLQSRFLASLLRWRARQDSLSLVWSQMAAIGYSGTSGGNSGSISGGRRKRGAATAAGGAAVKLNRNGKPRKARVVDSARAVVESMRGSDAEADLQLDTFATLIAMTTTEATTADVPSS
jgi:hypothetical protein